MKHNVMLRLELSILEFDDRVIFTHVLNVTIGDFHIEQLIFNVAMERQNC